MNNHFPLNRFDFSDLVKDIYKMIEPSWVEIAFDKITVGYVGIYVNSDFSLNFGKDNDEWVLVGN